MQVKQNQRLGWAHFKIIFCKRYKNSWSHFAEPDSQFMTLSRKQFLELAEMMQLSHRFNDENKSAGMHFYY
jgi:hypothetical protein